MIKNYGLKFDIPSDKHWVFGKSSNPTDIIQADGDWGPYLPVKEFQSTANLETYACVVYTILNCAEILIKKIYNEERNYSERFLAKLLETGQNRGSSPDTACETLRTFGTPPEAVYPFIDDFNEYFKDLPQSVRDIAEEFTKEWDFNHDFVPPTHEAITRALQCSPLLISVYAWVQNDKGYYYRPEGYTDVHATTLFYQSEGNFRRVFDTYDSPMIKDYDWDTMPMIVKRFTIKKREKKLSWWQTFLTNLYRYLRIIKNL